jgi:SAM-dependent methyltransferase
MNRDDDTPQDPIPVAEIDRASSINMGAEPGSDTLVEHDPTLKWITTDFSDSDEITPPPVQTATNERTPPPALPAAKATTPPPIESTATSRQPSPPAKVPASESYSPPDGGREKATAAPAPTLANEPPPESAQRPVSVVKEYEGATPAALFSADDTPPPPSPVTPDEGVGAAPGSNLAESGDSDSALPSDAVELLPFGNEEPTPAPTAIASTEPTHSDNSPREKSATEGPPSLSVPDAQTEPHEVEPEAVEMLESTEHPIESSTTSAPAEPSLTQTPPPVPVELSAHAASAPRPSASAAALFDEYQSPASDGEAIPEALARRMLQKRGKPWYEEVFDEDFLRTLPFMTTEQTAREVKFIREALSPAKGGDVLDIGCGYGRHALELAQQGLRLTGLDLSLPMLIKAADSAQRRGLAVNFVHADMREMTFNAQFDAAYCVLSSFGYFDEETNLRVATAIGRALKPGGRFLLDIINRDYIVRDLPSRVWWEGDGCVVLEEVDFNYHTSRVLIRRSVVFGNGRQSEQELSMRAYSLHEVGKILRQAGLRVIDVSGGLATKSRFFGAASRNIIALCERPAS